MEKIEAYKSFDGILFMLEAECVQYEKEKEAISNAYLRGYLDGFENCKEFYEKYTIESD